MLTATEEMVGSASPDMVTPNPMSSTRSGPNDRSMLMIHGPVPVPADSDQLGPLWPCRCCTDSSGEKAGCSAVVSPPEPSWPVSPRIPWATGLPLPLAAATSAARSASWKATPPSVIPAAPTFSSPYRATEPICTPTSSSGPLCRYSRKPSPSTTMTGGCGPAAEMNSTDRPGDDASLGRSTQSSAASMASERSPVTSSARWPGVTPTVRPSRPPCWPRPTVRLSATVAWTPARWPSSVARRPGSWPGSSTAGSNAGGLAVVSSTPVSTPWIVVPVVAGIAVVSSDCTDGWARARSAIAGISRLPSSSARSGSASAVSPV